jgi:hypothetical protein
MSRRLKDNVANRMRIYKHPDELPYDWDEAFSAEDVFNKRTVLKHFFLHSPIGQKYFWIEREKAKPLAGILCRTQLPFTLGPVTIFRPALVCSIPMPFSTDPGFSDQEGIAEVAGLMENFDGGFRMIGGLQKKSADIPGWAWRRHLVNIDMDIRWQDFESYINCFRSDYRSRVSESLGRGRDLKRILVSNDKFEPKVYELYEKIAQKYNSLILPIRFFLEIPSEKSIIGLQMGEEILAWALLIPSDKYLYFLFGGYKEEFNHKYHLYNNLLLSIIRFSIENGFKRLNLGQTAELSKMRLGGYPVERYILVSHAGSAIRQIVLKTDIFSYRKHYPLPRVFKDN